MDSEELEESPSEFSASEDEWSPQKVGVSPTKDKTFNAKHRSQSNSGKSTSKKLPLKPTRISRRIATRLGKPLSDHETDSDSAAPAAEIQSEESYSSEEEPPKKRPTKRRVNKSCTSPKKPIKLTTFTVEQLYKKYRPDLAASSSRKTSAVKRKAEKPKPQEDDSSGDDYLMDPDELDLDSEFFNPIETTCKSDVVFDCNAGLAVGQSDDEDENQPLSSVKKLDEICLDINRKLIKQISEAGCNLINSAEASEVSQGRKVEQNLEEQNVSNLLLAGERNNLKKAILTSGGNNSVSVEKNQSQDQEKVVEFTIRTKPLEPSKPQKKKVDLLTAIKRLMNREKRQNQIYLHKVSVLCWIGHGTFLNKTLTKSDLQEQITKKLLPSPNCRPKGRTNLLYFEQITRYFRKVIKLRNNEWHFRSSSTNCPPLAAMLKYQILKKTAFSKRDYILLFLLMLRSLCIHSRLVMSLVVPAKQVSPKDFYRMTAQSSHDLEADRRLLMEFHRAPKHSTIFKVKEKLATLVKKDSDEIRSKASKRKRLMRSMASIPQLDGSNDIVESKASKGSGLKLMQESFLDVEQKVNSKLPKRQKKTEEPAFSEGLDETVRRRREKILAAYRASKEQRVWQQTSSEDQYVESHSNKEGKLKKARRNRPGVDMWVEVYCELEDKWISIDVLSGKVHRLEDVVNAASQPITYVLAWNNDGTIKDVSPRYISRLGTKKSKLRVDDAWLEATLSPYRIRRATRRDRSEDLKFDKLLNKRPFPEQIAEYKNHPRFALERHLLRHEAIYPRDAVVLSHIKGEPIYPRDCVHALLSREGWLRQAKTVKLYEEPYKVVKAKARLDRYTRISVSGGQTELFGAWQVQDYEPPVAEDGKVPRSAYGNVELFKPCMLPKGTVHLQLPGLNKVCKRMRVDCASAITGFEFRNGACQAIYDGYVVCEEFRDQVIDEWYQDQVELERKHDEKIRKRVYGNWKRLIVGLFIRKKLKDRYNFDNF
ncbi:DNA repair protein complementing XP-C cells homolog [Wyeomyia smithii]|uniref:DNA repair protein complementing XP-C cells homolog n=1 Tax=Wyeomyia smithii TaxID=174621 RepID=UPI002467D6A5|nr:DNA repair protein complementing XP-C cells homolog [Wyeomyia smithii]